MTTQLELITTYLFLRCSPPDNLCLSLDVLPCFEAVRPDLEKIKVYS